MTGNIVRMLIYLLDIRAILFKSKWWGRKG